MALPSLFKTTDEYLQTLIARVQALGSRLTDFNDGSVTRTFFEAFAAGASQQSAVVDQLRRDSYLATATGDALDTKAADYQVARKAAAPATGTVRITRTGTSLPAVTIPAGWGQLATLPSPGLPSLPYVTLADATLPAGTGTQTVDVAGTCAFAGAAGNIVQGSTAQTATIAVNPVDGFDTSSGFVLRGPWSGGVDAETDDALRARVPLEVAARVKGRWASFMAAALRVTGVTSAQVLQAGDSRADSTTVLPGSVEVYYKGDAGLLGAVGAECANASMLGQTLVVAQATAARTIAALTVYCDSGVDTTALAATVKAAVQAVVNGGDVGAKVRYSRAVTAVHAIDDVVSVGLPFAQFRLSGETSGTAHDLPVPPTEYASLADADVTVTVTTL